MKDVEKISTFKSDLKKIGTPKLQNNEDLSPFELVLENLDISLPQQDAINENMKKPHRNHDEINNPEILNIIDNFFPHEQNSSPFDKLSPIDIHEENPLSLQSVILFPTPVPKLSNNSPTQPAPFLTENEQSDNTVENLYSHLKENLNVTNYFAAILESFGQNLDINNPEYDIFRSDSLLVAQSEIGGKCITSGQKEIQGVCLPLAQCPGLSSVQQQTQYIHAMLYLFNSVCRYEEAQVYFCCPFYTLSAALPGALSTISPPIQHSPVRVTVPGPDQCGKVNVKQGKVFGGNRVTDRQWPWLAAIGGPVSETVFRVTCSGALITKRHVITAAHCFYSSTYEQPLYVRLGDTDLTANTHPLHRDYYILARNFPLYHKSVSINDVTLLTLDRDVIFDDYVQPACLPYDALDAPLPGDDVTAVGYGRQHRSSFPPPTYPKSVKLTVLPNSFCQQSYYSSRTFPVIDHRTFCVGDKGRNGTCEGDSGGPVHRFDPARGRYVVVGIVKGGGGCGLVDLPSVNTRLAPFLPWVDSVVKLT